MLSERTTAVLRQVGLDVETSAMGYYQQYFGIDEPACVSPKAIDAGDRQAGTAP
jgi:hypothetical protein